MPNAPNFKHKNSIAPHVTGCGVLLVVESLYSGYRIIRTADSKLTVVPLVKSI